jgi:multiple sugar transport system ATP-binding protein
MARVVLDNLCKVYRGPNRQTIHAVRNLSLAVEDGELLVLLGPSGCGKTTTLRLIAGLETPDQGAICFDGREMNQVAPKDRDVAMVFQHAALFPHMTVFENMAFGLTVRKVPKAEIERRVREAATLLDLESCLDRFPNALSGGERQRVAFGRAIVRRPELFLFYEPLSNLDAPSRAQLRRETARLQRQLRVTTLHVTHDQAEAMALGDRVAVMNHGVIQQLATPAEIYHQPANLFVAGFVGSPPMNLFRGVLAPAGDTLRFLGGEASRAFVPRNGNLKLGDLPSPNPLPSTGGEKVAPGKSGTFSVPIDGSAAQKLLSYVGKQVVLGVRPEDIVPGTGSDPVTSASAIQAEVRAVERFGFDTHLHLAAGMHAFVARWRGDSNPVPSHGCLFVGFDMRKALFFDPTSGAAIR